MRGRLTHILLAMLVVPVAALAFRHAPSFEDRLRDYDIVVTGTMREIQWLGGRATRRALVTIDVSDVIWGDVGPGDTLEIEWQGYWEDGPHRHEDIGERVFLLRHEARGLELENSMVIPARGREQIEEMLRDLPIRVKPVGDWRHSDEWGVVDLVYLNASEEERAFSGLKFEDGRLYVASESTRLEFSSGVMKIEEPIDRRPGAFVLDPSVPDIVVPARSEIRVRIDLDALFAVRQRDIAKFVGRVFFKVEGAGQGHYRTVGWGDY